MPYKDPSHEQACQSRRNVRRREQRRLAKARARGESVEPTVRRLYNPGPWKKVTEPEVQSPPLEPQPLSWIDKAQMAAYGYCGALKPNCF